MLLLFWPLFPFTKCCQDGECVATEKDLEGNEHEAGEPRSNSRTARKPDPDFKNPYDANVR